MQIIRPDSSAATHIDIGADVLGSVPGLPNRTQCRLGLATAAMFLRSCVVQALNRGDELCYSIHDVA